MEIKIKGKDPNEVERVTKRILSQNPDFGPDLSKGIEGESYTATIASRIDLVTRRDKA